MKISSLEATVPYMLSPNYKDRFYAEYHQLRLRLQKLNTFLDTYRKGDLPFKPTCSIIELEEQAVLMDKYLKLLKLRAKKEKVNL